MERKVNINNTSSFVPIWVQWYGTPKEFNYYSNQSKRSFPFILSTLPSKYSVSVKYFTPNQIKEPVFVYKSAQILFIDLFFEH